MLVVTLTLRKTQLLCQCVRTIRPTTTTFQTPYVHAFENIAGKGGIQISGAFMKRWTIISIQWRLPPWEAGRRLAVVAIRCPNCGSPAASTTEPNEYQCSNCRGKFHFVYPSDGTVVTDTRAHHCPLCGRPVQTTASFMCTECKRLDFCDGCVTAVPSMGTQRFVCRECTKQHGWACSRCGKFAPLTCIVCHRRGCKDHYMELFAHPQRKDKSVLNCPSCSGLICVGCAERRGLLSRPFCKKCHAQLSTAFGETLLRLLSSHYSRLIFLYLVRQGCGLSFCNCNRNEK